MPELTTTAIRWDPKGDPEAPEDERPILVEDTTPTTQVSRTSLGVLEAGLAETEQYVADLKQKINEYRAALGLSPRQEGREKA